jgi:hypothetical protein
MFPLRELGHAGTDDAFGCAINIGGVPGEVDPVRSMIRLTGGTTSTGQRHVLLDVHKETYGIICPWLLSSVPRGAGWYQIEVKASAVELATPP